VARDVVAEAFPADLDRFVSIDAGPSMEPTADHRQSPERRRKPMNATIVRASVYSGLIGIILGTALGVTLSSLDLRSFYPEAFYQEGSPGSGGAGVHAGGSFIEQFDLTNLTIPQDHLLRGGPPKDGIPALTDPKTVRASRADFLQPDDRIVAVTMNEESRAYPIRMLNWHEIVNDTLGGQAIAVVYCPLCDSVTVVDREIEGDTLEFGVSGMLYQSNVLMYDRQHDALWSQIMLEAISGPFAGQSLRHYPGWAITTFDQWKREHPNGTVVTFETGHQRNYDRNPYHDYMVSEQLYFPVKHDDDRLAQKDRVIGVRYRDIVRAYPVHAVHHAPDGRLIDDIAGSELIIEADSDTGHTAIVQAPAGAQTIHTFWFSWAATHPETEIYGKE
jgi:hypothetical protein